MGNQEDIILGDLLEEAGGHVLLEPDVALFALEALFANSIGEMLLEILATTRFFLFCHSFYL